MLWQSWQCLSSFGTPGCQRTEPCFLRLFFNLKDTSVLSFPIQTGIRTAFFLETFLTMNAIPPEILLAPKLFCLGSKQVLVCVVWSTHLLDHLVLWLAFCEMDMFGQDSNVTSRQPQKRAFTNSLGENTSLSCGEDNWIEKKNYGPQIHCNIHKLQRPTICSRFILFSVAVDVNDAGEGNMEIAITSAGGRNIQNHVRQIGPGQFEVSYTPMEEGPHSASVTFNGEHVIGEKKAILSSLCDLQSEQFLGVDLHFWILSFVMFFKLWNWHFMSHKTVLWLAQKAAR